MDLITAVKTGFAKYLDSSGRARRSEYWYWTLGIGIGALVLGLLSGVSDVFGILLLLFYAAVFIPSLMVSIRRLHDRGRSGLWLLLFFVPFGSIVLLVWYCQDSVPEPNQYGASPKLPVGGYA